MAKFRVRYTYSLKWKLHKLLEDKQISKSRLAMMWGVNNDTARKLVNKPFSLSLFQLTSLSYLLGLSLIDVINIIVDDSLKCATTFEEWEQTIKKRFKDQEETDENNNLPKNWFD